MNIGELNRRVDILTLIESRDSFGGVVGSWNATASVWAKIEPHLGRESLVNEQVQAIQEVVITMRYNPNITLNQRIRYLGKHYEILSIRDNLTKHKWTELLAKEIIDGIQR